MARWFRGLGLRSRTISSFLRCLNSDLPKETEKVAVHADERFAGAFRRAVGLPEDADSSRIDASYRDGILRITVPKRENAKPRRIQVKD